MEEGYLAKAFRLLKIPEGLNHELAHELCHRIGERDPTMIREVVRALNRGDLPGILVSWVQQNEGGDDW